MIQPKLTRLSFHMPYEPAVSVNRAYYRGRATNKKRAETVAWLHNFQVELKRLIDTPAIKLPAGSVKMDLTIFLSKSHVRGRKPDPSNFRKIPQDEAARVLGIDDNIFYGTDHPLYQTEGDSYIMFEFEWKHDGTWSTINKSTKK